MPQITVITAAVLFVVIFIDNGNCLPTEGQNRPVSTEVFSATKSPRNPETITKDAMEEGRSTSSWWNSAESRLVWKAIDGCFNEVDGPSCIKRKLVTFLDGVVRMSSIPLFGGLAMEKQLGDTKRSETPLTEEQLEASLPRDLSQKEDRLDQMLVEKFASIFHDRSLVLDLSAKDEEGRGKKKKKMIGYILAGVGAAAVAMGAVFYKGIALLTFKAFTVAKIALVLASILWIKKLKNSKSNNDRALSPPWAERREDITEGAHVLAYRGQLQHPIILS